MTTEERLEILERELARAKRRNYWFMTVLGLAVGLFALNWYLRAAEGVAKEVRANKFILVDAKGKYRAQLAVVDKVGPLLGLYGEDDKPRAMLSVIMDGPALTLFDKNSKSGVGLDIIHGAPAVRLYDKDGKARAVLSVTELGPWLGLYDENEKVIWSAPR